MVLYVTVIPNVDSIIIFYFISFVTEYCFSLLPDPPDIVNISRNQTVNESDTVTLTCEAVANPPANITWTSVPNDRFVSFPLTISGKQDEGWYMCTAANSILEPAKKTAYVTVESESKIVSHLEF